MRKNIADIMCIGAQKASTSWLHSLMKLHPLTVAHKVDTETSHDKETHFWSWNYGKGLNWYKSIMSAPDELRVMDFSPEYSTLPEKRVEECKRHSPSAKVFYILRNPFCRAMSALRMQLLRTDEDFSLQKEHPFNEKFLKMVEDAAIQKHSTYVKNYKLWSKYYDVKIVKYDDILDNKESALSDLFSFLELDFKNMPSVFAGEFAKKKASRVHKSKEYKFSKECYEYVEKLLKEEKTAAESFFDFQFRENFTY